MSSQERFLPPQFQAVEHLISFNQSGFILGEAGPNTLYGYLRDAVDPELVRIVNMNFGTALQNFSSIVGAPYDRGHFHFEVWKKPQYLIFRHLDRYMETHDRGEEFQEINRGLHESLLHAGGVLVTYQSQDNVSLAELSGHEYYATSFEEDLQYRIQSQL